MVQWLKLRFKPHVIVQIDKCSFLKFIISNRCYSKTGFIHAVDTGITLYKFKILIDEFSLNMFIYPFENNTWGKLDAIWTYMVLHYTNSLCIIYFLCVPKNRLWC